MGVRVPIHSIASTLLCLPLSFSHGLFTQTTCWGSGCVQLKETGAWCYIPKSGKTALLDCKGSQSDFQSVMDMHLAQDLSIAYYNGVDNSRFGGASWSVPANVGVVGLCISGHAGDGTLQTLCVNVNADNSISGSPYCEIADGPHVVSDGCYTFKPTFTPVIRTTTNPPPPSSINSSSSTTSSTTSPSSSSTSSSSSSSSSLPIASSETSVSPSPSPTEASSNPNSSGNPSNNMKNIGVAVIAVRQTATNSLTPSSTNSPSSTTPSTTSPSSSWSCSSSSLSTTTSETSSSPSPSPTKASSNPNFPGNSSNNMKYIGVPIIVAVIGLAGAIFGPRAWRERSQNQAAAAATAGGAQQQQAHQQPMQQPGLQQQPGLPPGFQPWPMQHQYPPPQQPPPAFYGNGGYGWA